MQILIPLIFNEWKNRFNIFIITLNEVCRIIISIQIEFRREFFSYYSNKSYIELLLIFPSSLFEKLVRNQCINNGRSEHIRIPNHHCHSCA